MSLPRLNEEFKKYAAAYTGGELLFFIDGSGGMPTVFGNNVTPGAIDSTLLAAGEFEARDDLRTKAAYWGEFGGMQYVDLRRGGVNDWLRQVPNGPTYLDPALKQLENNCLARRQPLPLHVLIISDGILTDQKPDYDPEETLNRLRRLPGVMIDCIITMAPSTNGADFITPLEQIAKPLNGDADMPEIGIARVWNGQELEAALCRFINARMAPEAAVTEATLQAVSALQQGTAKPMAAMSPIRWKK